MSNRAGGRFWGGGGEVLQSVPKLECQAASSEEQSFMETMLSHHCVFLFSLSSWTKRGKIQNRHEEEMKRKEIGPCHHPSGAVSRELNVCSWRKSQPWIEAPRRNYDIKLSSCYWILEMCIFLKMYHIFSSHYKSNTCSF